MDFSVLKSVGLVSFRFIDHLRTNMPSYNKRLRGVRNLMINSCSLRLQSVEIWPPYWCPANHPKVVQDDAGYETTLRSYLTTRRRLSVSFVDKKYISLSVPSIVEERGCRRENFQTSQRLGLCLLPHCRLGVFYKRHSIEAPLRR